MLIFPVTLYGEPSDIWKFVSVEHLYKIISPENLSKFRFVKKISVGCTLFAFVSEFSHKIFAVITPSTGSISHVSPAAAFSGTKSSQLQFPALHTHAEAASANKKNPKLVLDEIAPLPSIIPAVRYRSSQ